MMRYFRFCVFLLPFPGSRSSGKTVPSFRSTVLSLSSSSFLSAFLSHPNKNQKQRSVHGLSKPFFLLLGDDQEVPGREGFSGGVAGVNNSPGPGPGIAPPGPSFLR